MDLWIQYIVLEVWEILGEGMYNIREAVKNGIF